MLCPDVVVIMSRCKELALGILESMHSNGAPMSCKTYNIFFDTPQMYRTVGKLVPVLEQFVAWEVF